MTCSNVCHRQFDNGKCQDKTKVAAILIYFSFYDTLHPVTTIEASFPCNHCIYKGPSILPLSNNSAENKRGKSNNNSSHNKILICENYLLETATNISNINWPNVFHYNMLHIHTPQIRIMNLSSF